MACRETTPLELTNSNNIDKGVVVVEDVDETEAHDDDDSNIIENNNIFFLFITQWVWNDID